MFFRKKKVMDEFSQAISELMKHNNLENQKKVFDIFRAYVEEGKWLFSNGKVEDGNTSVLMIQEKGKNYIPVYTDDEHIKNKNSIIQTDINKYIESMCFEKEISGLVINPGIQNLYMEKEYILKILLHDKFPKQNNSGAPQKNWGEGIPEYKSSDLMTKGQILNFAMHVVHDYDLKDSGFMPVSYCDNSEALINYIMKKDGDIIFIVVYPYVFPNEPVLDEETKNTVLDLCKKFNAKCLFAPVGLCPCDEERAAASLLLKGDGFYVNYTGMEEIEK